VEVNEVLSECTARMMKKLNWHGVAMAEFKIDSRDGSAKLMEINGRFWGSLHLAIASGVDFPYMLINLLAGIEVPKSKQYRLGVRCRWLLGDLDNMMTIWTHRRSSLSLPLDHKGRLGTTIAFCKEFFNGSVNELWRAGDRRPAVTELKAYIKNHWHSIWKHK
jgi:predicted ATP-grasp superfamily ATP-dependent carboligase